MHSGLGMRREEDGVLRANLSFFSLRGHSLIPSVVSCLKITTACILSSFLVVDSGSVILMAVRLSLEDRPVSLVCILKDFENGFVKSEEAASLGSPSEQHCSLNLILCWIIARTCLAGGEWHCL